MTDSQQPQTTLSGQKRGRVGSATPPHADHVSFNQEQVGKRYGWVEIISPERRYTSGWSRLYVQARCTSCGDTRWYAYANLTSGKSKGCQSCSQPRQVPLWLSKRVASMQSRCTNPAARGYANYGARGITFEFSSVLEGALWVKNNLGLHRELELDRIDNNGPYAPGNLRYATRAEQSRNQRRSKMSTEQDAWARDESPLGYLTTCRYLRQGYSKDAIIGTAYKAVLEKRKNWKGIKARLEQLGFTT